MEEKSQNLILMVMMMMVCSCRPVALPHCPDLPTGGCSCFSDPGFYRFCLPLRSRLANSKCQVQWRASQGVPCPGARPPSPRPWRALLFSRCGRKPETQTGMREGLVTAARCVDRSVQLVLIPALFLSFPSRCRHVQ